ncbi:MAG: LytR C-terminal domain-containing protein [bacterium]
MTSNKKISAKIDKFFDSDCKKSDVSYLCADAPKKAVISEKAMDERKTFFEMINRKMIFGVVFAVIIFGLIGIAGYFYFQYKKAIAGDIAKDEIAGYVLKIGKFMILPEGEQPTMATVADKEKLSSQAFFAKAENGDKVLFFSKSQKAILYRPSKNMIIEATAMTGGLPTGTTPQSATVSEKQAPAEQPRVAVQPEKTQEQQSTQETAKSEPTQESKQSASVVVNNGTSTKGLAKTMAEKISKIEGITIASMGNAKGNFSKSIIVDLNGGKGQIAAEIAKNIGGGVGELPSGEIKPEGDILVILGE